MTARKEYRNAARSRRLIRSAFVEILHEKPLEKVTVTDIVNRAGINRSTFYAHYPDVKGIIDEITDEVITMFRPMLEEIDFDADLMSPEPLVRNVVGFLDRNQELFRLLGDSDYAYARMEQLKKMMIRQVLDAPNLPIRNRSGLDAELRIRLMLGGVIDTFRDWLNGEMDCTLEEITMQLIEIIREWTLAGLAENQ